jgi:hypothetical protein
MSKWVLIRVCLRLLMIHSGQAMTQMQTRQIHFPFIDHELILQCDMQLGTIGECGEMRTALAQLLGSYWYRQRRLPRRIRGYSGGLLDK